MTPPALLISSTAISTTSRNETSLIAMVPLKECRTPILIGGPLAAYDKAYCPRFPNSAATPTPAATRPVCPKNSRREAPAARGVASAPAWVCESCVCVVSFVFMMHHSFAMR